MAQFPSNLFLTGGNEEIMQPIQLSGLWNKIKILFATKSILHQKNVKLPIWPFIQCLEKVQSIFGPAKQTIEAEKMMGNLKRRKRLKP